MGRVLKGGAHRRDAYVLSAPGQPDELAQLPADAYAYTSAPVEPEPPPEPPAPRLDWVALQSQAEALIENAAADAEVLVRKAGTDARAIVDEALRQSAEIADAARNEGRHDGYAAGRAAADLEMEQMLATMRGLIDMARVERHKILQSAEPELVKLAMGIAERIVRQRAKSDAEVVVEMAREAVSRLVDRETITVRVNPSDLDAMREHRESVLALGDVKAMRLIEDQRVDRGGVIVETEAGTIDAKISTQLDEARRVLDLDADDDVVVLGDATTLTPPSRNGIHAASDAPATAKKSA